MGEVTDGIIEDGDTDDDDASTKARAGDTAGRWTTIVMCCGHHGITMFVLVPSENAK